MKLKKKLTLLAYTITGRPSSLHCGPEINKQIDHNILLKIPTGGRQTSWLFTKRGLGTGLEPGASRFTNNLTVKQYKIGLKCSLFPSIMRKRLHDKTRKAWISWLECKKNSDKFVYNRTFVVL